MRTRRASCAGPGVADYAELVRRSSQEPELVLAARDRRHRARVLAALGRRCSTTRAAPSGRRGSSAATRLDRAQLRPPLGRARARRASPRSASARTASRRDADVRRALARRDAARRAARRARRRAGRPRRDLPADVARGRVASHAIAHIGAIQVPIFSGFAAPAVAQRLQASEAKVVITQHESSRRGKPVPMLAILEEAMRESPARRARRARAVRARRAARRAAAARRSTPSTRTSSPTPPARPASRRASCTCRAASSSRSRARSPTRPTCTQGDVVHFATDMGWIMGPWTRRRRRRARRHDRLRRGRARLADADRLWRDGRAGARDRRSGSRRRSRARCSRTAHPTADLSSLRTFVTTGEPWNPEPYRWLFEDVGGSRVPIINCTGGTEVGACFLSPTPIGPIKACSVGGPALGMAMDVVDDDGTLARRHRRGRRARLPQAVPRA